MSIEKREDSLILRAGKSQDLEAKLSPIDIDLFRIEWQGKLKLCEFDPGDTIAFQIDKDGKISQFTYFGDEIDLAMSPFIRIKSEGGGK